MWSLLGAGIDLVARVRLLESTLEQIREDAANGPALVEQAIETMDEDELRAIIASMTRIGRDELEQVQDVRAFSRRLSEIAMEGVVTPVTPERDDDVPVGSVASAPTRAACRRAGTSGVLLPRTRVASTPSSTRRTIGSGR